tara:strand:- start:380 stop:1342 length:963 start_codon:yes stop_codon:yes gene_type:complete
MATPSLALIPSAYKVSGLASVLPMDGTGDFTHTRSTTATRINSSGAIETMAINVPRIDHTDGGCPILLLEPQSTNLYLNSGVLVTQNVTTTANDYTVSMYGTGSITFSGTSTGTLTGTGANDRVSVTFTATAGTLTSTVYGSVLNSQNEKLSYATSYIPTTTTTVTRTADICNDSGDVNTFNSVEGVIFVELENITGTESTNKMISLTDGSITNKIGLFINSGAISVESSGSGTNLGIYSKPLQSGFNKIAVKFKVNDCALWVNGTEYTDTSFAAFSASTLNSLVFNRGDLGQPFFGKVKQLQTFKTALTDTELQTLTTL